MHKHYGALHAVDGIDLRVERGEIFGLIGHNGAGKSTLFKMILGLVPATSGDIRVSGATVQGRDFRAARRHLGYLPENVVLYDNLNGLETLHFFARLKGAPLAECPAMLEKVGLAHAGKRPVREYSKGMRQRLGFAQALLGQPQVLFSTNPPAGWIRTPSAPSGTRWPSCASAASRWCSARTSWPSCSTASIGWR